MKKTIGILIVIAIVVAAIILWTRRAETPQGEPIATTDESAITEEATPENTTPEAVNEELKSVDLGDIEAELQGIDSEIDNLR